MATIEKFEELDIWILGMDLCKDIYNATNNEKFMRDFGLKDQIRRSAISIPSNISEGFERNSQLQFIYFLNVAKASCGELRTQLKIAKLLNYISEQEFNIIHEKCLSESKQIAGFMKYLKQSKIKK